MTSDHLACFPPMYNRFSDLLLTDELLLGLEKAGYTEPTPVQAQVIPPAMQGVDLMVSATTGSGKTAAYVIPILQRFLDIKSTAGGTRALVLVPTRELARQIHTYFLRLSSYTHLAAGVITGGERKSHQVATLRKSPEILVATPCRLLEYLGNGEVDLGDVEILVLDEADRMLDMGFIGEVVGILGHCRPQRQSLLFSATLHHRSLSRITDLLLQDPQVVEVNPAREQHPDIEHRVLFSDDPLHKQRQLLWLLQNESCSKTLVFTNTRERAEKLGAYLVDQVQRVGVLHGEMDHRERKRIMGLLRRGQISILIATDLAARGLDVPGMRRVINFDLPRSGDDYLHRTGRTGRAGVRGVAITLVLGPEYKRMDSIGRYLRLSFLRGGIKGLEARFKGPAKGKRKAIAKNKTRAKKTASKTKRKDRERKNIGKRRKPSGGVTKE